MAFKRWLSSRVANGNTATGVQALFSNTIGNGNTANGFQALFRNKGGSDNTANGEAALFSNTTGSDNTANGVNALSKNTSGVRNTAVGTLALFSSTTGIDNTATGFSALGGNEPGGSIRPTARMRSPAIQSATGAQPSAYKLSCQHQAEEHRNGPLHDGNTIGHYNTACGFQALAGLTTGSVNIALGFNSGVNLTTGSDNIDIGNAGVAGEGNTIRIGTNGTHTSTFIAGIRGITVASGLAVVVGSTGQIGTVTSSARLKTDIKPMDKASEAILALEPVTFRYKHELDPDGIRQFGLVAEQVEKVNPDLVARDTDGKVTNVRTKR